MAFATEIVPAAAVIVGEPHPDEEAFAGLATVMLPGLPGVAGSESEKFSPLIATGAEFVSVKIREDTPPALVVEGLKVFEISTAVAGSTI